MQDDKAQKENESKCFWEKRKKDACAWGIMITTSNFMHQILHLINPNATKEQKMLSGYFMIGSALSYMSFGFYFYGKADTIYYTVIYYMFRNAMRMLDLEKTRTIMPAEDW